MKPSQAWPWPGQAALRRSPQRACGRGGGQASRRCCATEPWLQSPRGCRCGWSEGRLRREGACELRAALVVPYLGAERRSEKPRAEGRRSGSRARLLGLPAAT